MEEKLSSTNKYSKSYRFGGEDYSPLHKAIQDGKELEVIQSLVDNGANINDTTIIEHHTPLYLAILKKEYVVAEYLICQGANVSTPDCNGKTCLDIVDDEETKKLIISHDYVSKNDKGRNQLHEAVNLKNYDRVLQLVCRGGEDYLSTDNKRNTCLHTAVRRNSKKIVVLLIEMYPILINAKNVKGTTALHYAVDFGFIEIFRELLEKGKANPNAADLLGNTPLHYAAKHKNNVMVEELVKAGGDINIANKKGITPKAIYNR